jgi:hypothetical protein
MYSGFDMLAGKVVAIFLPLDISIATKFVLRIAVVSAAGCGRGILKSRNAIFRGPFCVSKPAASGQRPWRSDPHQGRQRRAARPPYDPRRSLGREMANRARLDWLFGQAPLDKLAFNFCQVGLQ